METIAILLGITSLIMVIDLPDDRMRHLRDGKSFSDSAAIWWSAVVWVAAMVIAIVAEAR